MGLNRLLRIQDGELANAYVLHINKEIIMYSILIFAARLLYYCVATLPSLIQN